MSEIDYIEKMTKLKTKLREKFQEFMTKLEEDLNDQQIIELRLYMFYNILEDYCSWTNSFDCLPIYIKVGAFGDNYIEIIPHGDVIGEIK